MNMGSTVRKFFTCFSTMDEDRPTCQSRTKKSPCCKGSSSPHSNSPLPANISPPSSPNFLPRFLADGDGQLIVDDHNCIILEPIPRWASGVDEGGRLSSNENGITAGEARQDPSRTSTAPPPYESGGPNLNRRYSPPPAYFEAIMGNPQVGSPNA